MKAYLGRVHRANRHTAGEVYIVWADDLSTARDKFLEVTSSSPEEQIDIVCLDDFYATTGIAQKVFSE